MVREILYDMIHNSICGKGALGLCVSYMLYLAVYCVFCLFYKKYDLRRWRKFFKKIAPKKIHILIIGGLVIIFFIIFLLFDWRVNHQEHGFIRNDLAEQKDLEVLFTNEPREENDVNEFASKEYIKRLHISEENPMLEITKDNIEARYELFKNIYKIGEKKTGNGRKYNKRITNWLQKIRTEVTNQKSDTLEKYIEEYEKWNILFKYSGLSSDLYQSSRSAKDALVKWDYFTNEEGMLDIAGDAIYESECFLQYEDRDIHKEGESIIIGIKEIAFSNGKVYCQLYMKSQNQEELKKNDKELIVNAYVSMVYAAKEVFEEDIDYAKVNYYIGYICEKMLDEISNEATLYMEIAKEALQHYEIASDSLKMYQGYYLQEYNMQKNIENGINRLENLVGSN